MFRDVVPTDRKQLAYVVLDKDEHSYSHSHSHSDKKPRRCLPRLDLFHSVGWLRRLSPGRPHFFHTPPLQTEEECSDQVGVF